MMIGTSTFLMFVAALSTSTAAAVAVSDDRSEVFVASLASAGTALIVAEISATGHADVFSLLGLAVWTIAILVLVCCKS